MKAFLALLLIVGAVSADLSAVVDSMIQETRSHIANELDFKPINYKDGSWNPEFTKYDVSAELDTSTGKVILGEFAREVTPVLWGTPKDGVLETRFFIKRSTVNFDKFTAVNYTSGETAEGQLAVAFERTEMYSLIKMKAQGDACVTSLSTLTPIAMGDASALFTPKSELTHDLWIGAQNSLDYPLNRTIVGAGWPELAKVVAKTDLCTLLS